MYTGLDNWWLWIEFTTYIIHLVVLVYALIYLWHRKDRLYMKNRRPLLIFCIVVSGFITNAGIIQKQIAYNLLHAFPI